MTQLTPSQAARRFADDNGFKIVAVGRRYQATHSSGVSFERGGYAALLNEMRAVIGCIENGNAHPVHGFAIDAALLNEMRAVIGCIENGNAHPAHGFAIDADTPVGVEMCAGGTLVLPEPSADPVLNATANNFFGALEPITPDTVPMSREEMFAPVKAEQARIRRATRKASGKPPGGPWHVIFNGATVMKYGYPSRADALAVVRWGFNHAGTYFRNDWRTAAVTVEYRA